jgi:cobaltochelatase CobN
MVTHWGPPPGELFVDRSRDPDGEIVVAQCNPATR